MLSGGRYRPPVARVAGGWVRDKLLGRQSKDIDISIDIMSGSEFKDYIASYYESGNFPQRIHVSPFKVKESKMQLEPVRAKGSPLPPNPEVSFGMIAGQPIEILQLRGQERHEEGGHGLLDFRAGVAPEEDAKRRDLTINSMFYNITTGKVEDFTGRGRADLNNVDEQGQRQIILRTPLDAEQTFTDDALRILRVLRFLSRYENSIIATETFQGMMADRPRRNLYWRIQHPDPNEPGISPERVADEFKGIMKGSQPEKAIQSMLDLGLLQEMLNLPEDFLSHLSTQERQTLDMNQRTPHHKYGLMEHTLQVIKQANRIAQELGLSGEERIQINLAALFHDIGKLDPRSHVDMGGGRRGYSGSEDEQGLAHEQSSADMWRRFARTIMLSNKDRAAVADYIRGHMVHERAKVLSLGDYDPEKGPTARQRRSLKRYMRKNPSWAMHWILGEADALATGIEDEGRERPYRAGREIMTGIANEESFGDESKMFKPILNGNEIHQLLFPILGLSPKPPTGMPGYIGVVQEKLKDVADSYVPDPNLTPEQQQANWKQEAIALITSEPWIRELKQMYGLEENP